MKKIIALLLAIVSLFAMFSFVGCRKTEEKPDGGDSGNVEVDYQPNVTETYTGSINITMVLDETLPAWEAVVAEYKKFQPNVTVSLNNRTAEEYATLLTNDLNNSNGVIDIFQGNVVNPLLATKAYDMFRHISEKNQYADTIWANVLERDAYITMDREGEAYILNSNSLMTAWFYNVEALEGSGISVDDLKTWDDLMDACQTLKDDGWANPLGIGGSKTEILERQFAWLVRIYGDQYYRSEYPNIQYQPGDYGYSDLLGGFEMDNDDPDIELKAGYNMSELRLAKVMWDENDANYVGVKSEKFAEFWANMLKMKPYLPSSFVTTSQDDMRNEFIKNNKESSPVFFLELLGWGASFNGLMENSENPFTLGAFDYLPMQGEYVESQLVRDVGGNGGYISMRAGTKEKNEVNLDFIKFFMSPYGQSIYFDALERNGLVSEGLPTVKYVEIPDEWKEIYDNPRISWNGLADRNKFTVEMLLGLNDATYSATNYDSISALYNGGTFETYKNQVYVAHNEYSGRYATLRQWRDEAWLTPELNPKN